MSCVDESIASGEVPRICRIIFQNDRKCQLVSVSNPQYCYPAGSICNGANSSASVGLDLSSLVILERDILARAAIQLLANKDKTNDFDTSQYANSGLHDYSNFDSVGSDADYNIIRYGFLQKWSKGSVLSQIGNGQGLHHAWKPRYVELRQGDFSIFDELEQTSRTKLNTSVIDSSQVQKSDDKSIKGFVVNRNSRKRIELNSETCSCRVSIFRHAQAAMDSSNHSTTSSTHGNSSIFEIHTLGGSKKVFLASSPQECADWVRAINEAMISGVRNAKNKNGFSSMDNSSHTPKIFSPGKPMKESIGIANMISSYPVGNVDGKWSWEGCAAPYAAMISNYILWQRRLHFALFRDSDSSIHTVDKYKRVIDELIPSKAKVTVPVGYVKETCSEGTFVGRENNRITEKDMTDSAGSARHNLRQMIVNFGLLRDNNAVEYSASKGCSRSESPTIERTQLWKDMLRDEICVNGETISGTNLDGFHTSDSAVEAMFGLLSRHIYVASEAAYSRLQSNVKQFLTSPVNSNGCSPTVKDIKRMSEYHMVACARKILLQSNRTQSGGDTYYCVDALLRDKHTNMAESRVGTNNAIEDPNNIFIVAPMSTSGEPLQLRVDIVELSQDLCVAVRASGEKSVAPDIRECGCVGESKFSGLESRFDKEIFVTPKSRNQTEDSLPEYLGEATPREYSPTIDHSVNNGSCRQQRRSQLQLSVEVEDVLSPSVKAKIATQFEQQHDCLNSNLDNETVVLPFESFPSQDANNFPRGEFDSTQANKSRLMNSNISAKDDLTVISDLTLDTIDALNIVSSSRGLTTYGYQPTSKLISNKSAMPDASTNVESTAIESNANPADASSTATSISEYHTPRKQSLFKQSKRAVSQLLSGGKGKKNSQIPVTPHRKLTDNSNGGVTSVGGGDVGEKSFSEPRAVCVAVRVRVYSESIYRICSADPQGRDDDNWAKLNGSYFQDFYIPAASATITNSRSLLKVQNSCYPEWANANLGRLGIGESLVSITAEKLVHNDHFFTE